MRMGERTKRVLALLTAGAMVFTNTGMDVLASTSIVVGGITSGEDKKDETPAESESESETGTEQESESESETGSEAESEAAYTDQKVFTCEGDQATVTVTVPDEAQMPAGTELEVQPVVENSVTYDEIKNALTNEAQEVLGISAFHLAFITDGEAQIPSDIDYQVQIDYKDAVLAVAEGQEDSSVGAYVNQAGATADIQTSENGAVEAVSLSTKELGDVAVVRTGATAQERTYTYEDDEVIINVTVPAEVTLPQDAELVVKPVDEKTKEYKETVEKTEAEVEDYVLQHAVYDIGFQVNGEEVEPENGDIKVAFQFKQPVLNTEAITDGDADIDVKVLHVKDDGVEDTQANANVEADGSVKNVELVTDSFSPYDLVLLASELPEGNYGRVNFSYNDEKDAFRNSSYYVNTPLGLAGNFGVVAFDTANLTVDCNSNILAKKLIKVSNDWGTRHISGELSYVQEYKVSSTQPERSSNADNLSTLVVGSDVEVTGTIGQRFYMNGNTKEIETSKLNVIKDRNSKITPYIDLQKVEEEIKQISSTLAQQSNVGCTQKFIGEMNQRAITVTCGKGECAYYNTNLEELNERNSGGNPITIKGISNGASLVINIDCQSSSSNITIPAIDVEGASYQETTNFEYGRVILNLLNSAGKTITLSRAYASVIAPEATIIAKHSVNGSLIGRNVTTETENHRTTFTGTTTPAQAEVDGTKTVDGQTPTQEQKFTFVLEEKKGQEWGVVEEVQNEGKGITFKNLQYSKESDIGEHWYRVSEKVDKMSDYNTDTTQYIMKVTVTKTGDVYSAKKEYFEVTNPKTEEKQSVDKITFNNTTKKTELQIPVKKTAESDVWGNRTFEFELTAVDSAPMPEKNGSMVALSKPANGDTATGTFGKIEYKKTGIYQYKITEKAGNDSSVVYDNSEYIVTVEVKKNTDGELVASVTKIQKVKDGQTTDVAEVEFVNTEYTAAGSVTLEARKTLNGAAPGAGKFSFELKDKAGKVLQTKANDGKGKVTFDPISYKLEDAGKEFTYTVSEVIPTDEAGVTYDKSVYTVTVKVTDNGNGTLGTKVSYQKGEEKVNGISFANTYAASGSVSLEASKTLNGAAPAAGKFSFELKDKAGKVLQTKANDGKGKVTFDPISYKLEDAGKEFTYTVSEVIPTDEAGVTYDKSVYTVTVKVTDNGNGTLGTKVSYQKGEEKVNGISFANTYAASGSVSLEAGKTLNGAAPAAGKFSFELKDKAGKVLQTKANDGKGKVTFDPISYKLEDAGKEFTYTVSEVIPTDEAGVTYDKSVYTVTVKVTDNGNGTLGTKVSYQKGEEKVNGISFANTYAASGSVSLEAGKTLNGAAPAAGKFSFELKDKAGKVLQTKANDGKGKVTFDPISYKLEDAGKEFTYTVSEVIPTDEAGVTYDKSVYAVTVKVTDNGNGTLGTKVSYQKGEEKVNGISFANTYAASGSVSLEASKTLNGAAPAAGKFSFELKDKAGKVLQTKANDGNGKVTFDPISYELKDAGKEFTYTVSEVIPTDKAGVTYDKSAYTVTVKVTDNGNGTLGTETSYQKGGEKVEEISFANTYYEEGKVNLKATKDFSGTTWQDETFQFVLTAGSADAGEVTTSPMPKDTVDGSKTVTVTKDNQKVAFGDIVYVNNGTYNYQIHEVNDKQAGITYDGAVWNVQVIVSNGQNGVKNVAIQYKKSTDETYTPWNDANDAFAVTFHNTYAEKGTARIQVAKEFNADEYPTGDDAFTFTLKAAPNEEGTTESPLPEQTTVKVTDANAVSFGDITFDTNGTYNYTVEENAGMLPNVIYDKTVYDVQIKVEDGGKADGVKKITVMSKKQADKEYAPLDGTVFTAAFSNIRYAVNVKKTDLTGVNEVKGATLTVYKASDINEDGTVKENAEKVTEFVSDGGANDISEELIRGEAYVLVETSAPEGYAFTNNIPFTLNEDGTVTVDKELQAEDGTILVKDALIGEQKVPLTATKTLTGAALTGDDFSFTLEEVKEDGTTELLQTKTNDAAGKVAFDDLTYDYKAEGKTFTYVVKETDTQKTGITYSKEAYTVKVVISKADTEGKMTAEVSYTDATGKAADAMNFTNTFAGSVSLVKVGPQQQKLAGAKFMLYQQQPSTDYKAYAETEYVTDANGNIKVEGLPEGNYYFVETTAPDGYVIKMNDDGTAKQYPFTIQAGKAEATVGVDIDLGLIENDTITPGEGGDIDLGSVTIEKSVLNAAGKTITADGTTFYAGVFSKNQDGTYTLVKSATLEWNGKVTIKDLTVGTYYLFETTKQGDRINEADFAFEITGNGQEFQIKSDENTDVKLVNKEKETVESEEETEKESEVKTETKTKKTTTVKTGDTTPIALYVGLLAAAAVLIALIVFLRKRKNK